MKNTILSLSTLLQSCAHWNNFLSLDSDTQIYILINLWYCSGYVTLEHQLRIIIYDTPVEICCVELESDLFPRCSNPFSKGYTRFSFLKFLN